MDAPQFQRTTQAVRQSWEVQRKPQGTHFSSKEAKAPERQTRRDRMENSMPGQVRDSGHQRHTEFRPRLPLQVSYFTSEGSHSSPIKWGNNGPNCGIGTNGQYVEHSPKHSSVNSQ